MNIRKAKLSDVEAIHELVNYYAKKGLMLPRSRSTLYEFIRDFTVVEIDNEIVGVGALQILWIDLAEIRTLAIKENLFSKGIGKQLVEYFLREAKSLGIQRVFTLTYQPAFFEKCGFNQIDKEQMPHKVWKYCLNCPKFPNCDEVCLVTEINQKIQEIGKEEL